MKRAARFVVQGTVQGVFKSHADETSSSKFSYWKILDRKSFGNEFQNFQIFYSKQNRNDFVADDFIWNTCSMEVTL